jgi:hypothetical protein
MAQSGEKEDIHGHSGWLIPAAFLFVVMLLSGLLLGWYLRPGPKAPPMLTGQSDLVPVTLAGLSLQVPANYIQNPTARAGGEQDSLALAALFPSWQGYSPDVARQFQGNAPDSGTIRILLRRDTNPMDPATRLARIYGPYFVAPEGATGLFDLRQYSFAANSGYEKNELFVGGNGKRLLLLLCERAAANLPSPNCLATDRPLGDGVSYSFRFKRAYLARWREVSGGVDALIARFKKTEVRD